MFDTIEKIKV